MVLVTLSGEHAVGKTSSVNGLVLETPLIKITDADMIPIKGTGFKQQCMRATLMFNVLNAVSPSINTIIDRSPLDFKVYNQVVMDNSKEYYICDEIAERLIMTYKRCGAFINILVYDEYEKIKERIKKRGREGLREEEEIFTKRVYDLFYSENGRHFERITGVPSVLVHVNDLPEYLSSLLS